jgi:hypothetical protein
MGVLGYEREAEDFYPSPPWCTEALLKHFTPRGTVWEPACGQGHICKVLEAKGHKVIATDLVDRGYGTPDKDFLKFDALPDPSIQAIITNPPYSDTLPSNFITKSLDLMKPVDGSVAMLLRNEFDSASKRTKLFAHPAFSLKLVLTKRPRWIEDSTGSPRHNYAWFCWDWKTVGQAPLITWGQ